MTLLSANLGVALLSLLVGWVGLAPARRALGAWGYHLLAYPVGLLVLPMGSVVSSLAGATYGLKAVAVAVVGYTAVVAACSWWIVREQSVGDELPWTSWALWGGLMGAAAVAVDTLGPTIGGYDSIFHYQSWGLWLHEVGSFTPDLLGAYNLFLPSLHASVLALGGDWAFVAYPLMSLNLLVVLGWAMWRSMPPALGGGVKAAIVVVACGLLATLTQYVYHTFYSHSHMASAFFLLVSVVAAREAYLGLGAGRPASGRAFAFASGLTAAGFALVRSDGLAYVLAILVLYALLEVASTEGIKRLHAAYAGLFGVLGVAFGVAFVQLGMWKSHKMTGRTAAAVLVVLVLIALATPIVVPWARRWFADRRVLIGSLVAINAVGVLVLWSLNSSRFGQSVSNMMANLADKGGWGFVWYFVIGIVFVSVALRRAWESDEWSDVLLYAVAQFFFVALAVHGLTHVGRIARADSFNRLVFHALPLILWYTARFVGGLAKTLMPTERAR